MSAKNIIDDNVEFSICTIKGNGNLSIPKNYVKEFISIFHCNDKGEVYKIQIADSAYFDRLKSISQEFIKYFPETYRLFDFLKKMPKDEKFTIIPVNVNKDESMNNYLEINRGVHEINNIPFPNLDKNLIDTYLIYLFGDKRKDVGIRDKNKRVCRFCGKSFPDVTFKNRSHAISESLGNKLLLCNEECDVCNKKFDEKGIERDLINLLQFSLNLYEIKGKNGQRNFKGKSIEFDNKKNGGGVLVNSDQSIDDNNYRNFVIEEPTLSFIPQNIYKCISKFAISLINRIYLPRLTKTIEWIASDDFTTSLPPIWFRQTSSCDQPMMGIYVKKGSDSNMIPEFIIRLYISNNEFLFTFPYVDNHLVAVNTTEWKKFISDTFSLNDYHEMDLSSAEKQFLKINLEIKKQEGSEFVSLKKSEYKLLSDEERMLKYPKASGFIIEED